MRAHRVEAAIERGGTLVLDGLPFDEGEAVEVIVLSRASAVRGLDLYPLRGKTVRYTAPAEPVADGGWESG